jgi:anaerobic magnesium-protoporphyrin IX monomethyl ester cyclase
MKNILFIEPPPTIDWAISSKISKAGRRHPCLNETGEQVYSYQNLSCAAILRNSGYVVDYIHCPTQKLDVASTQKLIKEKKPDALVIMVEHINLDVSDALSRFAKQQAVTVIWVGPFVTALHEEQILKKDCVSFILRKEWDYSVGNLLKAFAEKTDLAAVNGLTWINGDSVVVNKDEPPVENMDALPFPAYDLLDLSAFYESVFVKFPAATMITSRGCPFNCIYCSYPQTIYGHKYRAMSPERVVREMQYLVNDLGVKEIRIDDDTFDINQKRVIDICKLIVEKKLKVVFSVQSRPQLMTEETAFWLKKAGCRMVLFGVESGNDEILQKIRKKTTKDEIRRGVSIAKKHHIDVLNCVMLGFFWDTKETVEETINFTFELNAEFTQVSTPTPLPGTDYFAILKKNNCFLTEDWTRHDSVHHSSVQLPHLTNDEINFFLNTFYRRYYRRPQYLWMMFCRMFRSWGNIAQSLRKINVLFTK